ncbi:MAG: right-handed parallel beta-helix repeat-containing protein [Lewinellaceae bacterium]|nr:right-handed parallel beta-helix repeat-containing protein [Lewinellaceae bacterium]
MKRIIYCIFSVFCLLAALPAIGQVAYVKQDASGANNGTSWANAYTSLHSALADATAAQVWVAAGTYVPGTDTMDVFFVGRSVILYGGFAGTETSLDQRDVSAHATILSGDLAGDDIAGNFTTNRSDNALHVVYVDSLVTGGVTIDGFTVRSGHGNAETNSQPEYYYRGGGIFAYSRVAVRNCFFTQNHARSGASVFVRSSTANGSQIEDCRFEDNISNSQSAGIYIEAASDIIVDNCSFTGNSTNRGVLYPAYCTNVQILNCAFENNENSSGYGGALFVWQPVNLYIGHCTFLNNTSANAAGIYIDQRELTSYDPDLAIIDSCLFDGNVTTDYGGSGIYFYNASFTLMNTTFVNGEAPSSAPGIYAGGDNQNFIIDNCTFENNTSNFAASIANYVGLGVALIQNSTFRNNRANNGGGTISGGFTSRTTVENCTFEENSAGYGGAIFVQNDSTEMTVLNSSFFGNVANTSSGGAILTNTSIPLTVENCNFEANQGATGGAISVTEDSLDISVLTVRNTIFNYNIADTQGGAIYINNADATIESSLFINNNAFDVGNGGALSLNSSVGGEVEDLQVMITNCTFADNVGALAAAIASWTDGTATSTATLQNNIFSNPLGLDYVVEAGAPEVVSNGGNLAILDLQPEVFSNAMDILGQDPLFVEPEDFDFHIMEGSPCIDAGVAAGAPEFDIEGRPRYDGVDIGAYEFDKTIGVQERPVYDKGQLSLFPNPVSENAFLKMENEWTGTLQAVIFTLSGQQVQSFAIEKTASAQQWPLKVGQLQRGAYKVVVSNGKNALAVHLLRL